MQWRRGGDGGGDGAAVAMVTAVVAVVVVAVHYGAKQCDIETLNYTISHKLESLRVSKVSERANK